LAYGGWHKIFHAMAPPRLKFYSTALSPLWVQAVLDK
jgi:hypothetical protein